MNSELLKKIIYLFSLPLLYIIYFIVGLLPRDKTLWVFGSWNGKRFADNSKWFFLYCVKTTQSDIKFKWISRDKKIIQRLNKMGYDAFYLYSLKGLYYSMRGGVYIFDSFSRDISFWLSRGARKVLLFHGVPIKKIGLDIDNTENLFYRCYRGHILERMFLRLLQPWWVEKYDLIPSASEYCSNCFQTAFGVQPTKTPITGFPRNDAMIEESYVSQINIKDSNNLKFDQYEKSIIYMPTFRDTDRKSRVIPIDWDKMNSLFREYNSLFILKLHPNEKLDLSLTNYTNIKRISTDLDIYPFFKQIDLLITDYSSVSLDFMSLNKNVIFYTYDILKYKQTDRSLYLSLDEVIQGQPTVKNFEELYNILKDYLNDNPITKIQPQLLSKRFHLYNDGKSSERVFKRIEDI